MAEQFDEPTHNDTAATVAGAELQDSGLPKRRPRRAASRPAGAPTAETTASAAQTINLSAEVPVTTVGSDRTDAAGSSPVGAQGDYVGAPIADAPPAAPVKAKRQPRRATRAAEAPNVVAEPIIDVAATVGGGASVVSEAPVRTRKRRTKEPVATVETSASDSATTAEVAAAAVSDVAEPAETKPVRARRGRRSAVSGSESGDALAPAAEVTATESTALETTATETTADVEPAAAAAPKERVRRTRSRRRDADTAPDAAPETAADQAASATGTAGTGTGAQSRAADLEVLGAFGQTSANEPEADDAEATDEAGATPATSPNGVLVEDIFNLFSAAPEPTRTATAATDVLDSLGDSLFQEARPVRARRRVVSAAGAPGSSKPEVLDAEGTKVSFTSGDSADDAEDLDDVDGIDAAATSGDEDDSNARRRRRRGGRGRRGRVRTDEEIAADEAAGIEDGADFEAGEGQDEAGDDADADSASSTRRRRRRRRGAADDSVEISPDDPPNTVVRVRGVRRNDEVRALKGSTRLEAKRQRRREGRETSRRKQVITEAEFLARRESVERTMVVRERSGRTQVAVLEDGVLVEHYVARKTQTSTVGNVYLGKVQNVLPSMEAAFVDIGRGRNAVLYAGEVNWDAAGLEGQPRRIESALKPGDAVLVQVTKDPIGHKGARLTSQVSLPGRFIVLVPGGSMTGISRKLPDVERSRLKKILKAVMPAEMGVIVRTAAEGASEDELVRDVERLTSQWAEIQAANKKMNAPASLSSEPDLAIKVVRDVFNEDFTSMKVQGDGAFGSIHSYLDSVAPELAHRVTQFDGTGDIFAELRVDEQLQKAMDRNVFLPSGGSLVIDRTEAMTVVDVNTGKFTGSGGTLEETVTKNNLEAAEEIVRQLRLRDIGGIIVVDFIDMVLESNRDLVLRRLVECLSRDRTRHQVAEVTSLGLVQMTRKRVGEGLLEVFSESCSHCNGRGVVLHSEPVEGNHQVHEIAGYADSNRGSRSEGRSNDRSNDRANNNGRGRQRNQRGRGNAANDADPRVEEVEAAPATAPVQVLSDEVRSKARETIASIAAAAAHAHEHEDASGGAENVTNVSVSDAVPAVESDGSNE